MDDVYESKYRGYQVLVQGAEPIYAPGTGTMIGRMKELTAEFATFQPEEPRLDSTGEQVKDMFTGDPLTTANIQGFVFDLQEQATRKGWTVEEAELVRLRVEDQCRLTPNDCWRRTIRKLVAPIPNYDTLHHNQVPVIAEQIGMIPEFLSYERQEKNRESVIRALEEKLNAAQAEDALTAA